MPERVHPFVLTAAEEADKGGISRRDFFKYAACFGVSTLVAGRLLGLGGAELARAAATPDWDKLEQESPFEIKNWLIQLAQKDCTPPACNYINAGRGNPNFLNTTVRKGLSLLTLFAAEVSEELWPAEDIGLRIQKKGISAKFDTFINDNISRSGAQQLKDAMAYATSLGMDPDEVVFELTDAIQGDFYPDPPRIFPAVEAVVNKYLDRVVFSGNPPKGKFNLFATEGATAAMIYIFNSLKENKILNSGDRVAIVTPIFSPYIELPQLKDYGLEPIYIEASEDQGWQVPDSELAKLKKFKPKALYMVNPTNPTSVSLNSDTVKRMADTIRECNKDMIIISDTVYASFVDEFNTFGKELPENIFGVYSFSKYFGVTGWRLGVIMTHENCVVDRLIKKLPKKDQALLDMRYRLVSTKPGDIKFYERLEIDSRQVALAHTGGLSGPQQVAMCLFSLFELLDSDYAYKQSIMDILKKRWAALFKALQITEPTGNNLTRYYALINLYELGTQMYGKDFADKLKKRHALEFLYNLAKKYHTVCLPGAGFEGPYWSLRVALANISEKDCSDIGENIRSVMADYRKQLG